MLEQSQSWAVFGNSRLLALASEEGYYPQHRINGQHRVHVNIQAASSVQVQICTNECMCSLPMCHTEFIQRHGRFYRSTAYELCVCVYVCWQARVQCVLHVCVCVCVSVRVFFLNVLA